MKSFIRLISPATGEVWELSKVTSSTVKVVMLQVSKHERTNTVKDKQEFIDQLRVGSNDPRLADWLTSEIRRRYSVNELDKAIEAAVHEISDVMDFMTNITKAINESRNPFIGGRVSMGSLFGFGVVAPTFTSIVDLFSKYPEKMGGEIGGLSSDWRIKED